MNTHDRTPQPPSIYDLSLNVRVSWQAHSLSTAGSNGSNKMMPRHQLLADGTETDACSGAIAKHHHAALLAQYLQAAGIPFCPARLRRDNRRAAALGELAAYKGMAIEQILTQWGLCDAHGFLVMTKNARTPITREMAHAQGPLTVYLHIPAEQEAPFRQMLSTIGYWGQTNSFATCLGVEHSTPNEDECARPRQDLPANGT